MKRFFFALAICLSSTFLWAVPTPETESKKTVLFLGGGDHSPWYFLGMFYAIEAYQIPIDSIVASSWGAWVSALWIEGWSPDAIQKLFLDPQIKPFVGVEQLSKTALQKKAPLFPIANSKIPSLQARFFLLKDTAGFLKAGNRSLDNDSLSIQNALFKFRIQESLYQKIIYPSKAFLALSCDGTSGSSVNDIFKTLPLEKHLASGEFCEQIPKPNKKDSSVISIVAIPVPLRYKDTISDPWKRTLWNNALNDIKINPPPAVLIRPHQVSNDSPEAWIQAGFSAIEARLGDLSKVRGRAPSSLRSLDSLIPWFKYNPSFESVPAQIYSHIKSYWDVSDTGIVAPSRFVKKIMSNPLYDDISFDLEEDADLVIGAKAPPLLDFYLGAFGSNVLGPNAYGKIEFHFINQFEYLFSTEAFYGLNSYAIRPEIRLARLWEGRGDFFIKADFSHIEPLKSYFSEEALWNRIFSESRTDFSTGFAYEVSSEEQLNFSVLFGSRTYKTAYSKSDGDFKTTPIEPKFTYDYSTPDFEPWFGSSGFGIHGEFSMRSIFAGFDGFVPMHYRSELSADYHYSPLPFLSLGAGASGAVSLYHKEGYGYVYPELLNSEPIDNAHRHRMLPTPWSSEWYFAETRSYHYGLVRLQAGLHKGWFGAWLFAAYIKDFEENATVAMKDHRFMLEPTLRFAYRSLDVRAGLSRIVDYSNTKDLKKWKDYNFFIKFGAYDFL